MLIYKYAYMNLFNSFYAKTFLVNLKLKKIKR